MITIDDKLRAGGSVALNYIGEFFMGTDPVHETLRTVTRKFDELGIPYAVVGALAMGAHGYVRATVDVDLLVTLEGNQTAREKLEGLGYLPAFAGSRNLR